MAFKWKLAQYLEIRWWKNYQKKLDDTYLDGKKDYWNRVLDACKLEVPKGKTILDVGCGPSGVYSILEGNEVEGVDPLIEKYTNEIKFFSPNTFPHVQFHTTPFEDFVAQKQYDEVFCLNAINHFRSLEESIKKLHEVLKPGGTMLVGIDGHRHAFLKKLFQTIHMDLLHPIQFSLDDYVQKFEQAGFVTKNKVTFTTGNIFNYYLVEFSK